MSRYDHNHAHSTMNTTIMVLLTVAVIIILGGLAVGLAIIT